MRIAVYHNQPPGGARRALHGFATVLAGRHRLDVFTLTTADQSMLRDADFADKVTTLPFETTRPVRGGFLLNEIRWSRDLDRLDDVNREAARLIDGGSYDLAFVDACRFTFAPQVLRHLRTPSVYYCHHGPWRVDGLSEHIARSPYESLRHLAHLPLRKRLEERMRQQDRELTRRATAVVTNSRFTRTRLQETCGVDATVCPPGIAIQPPRARRREAGHVLSVGDLVPHKGHDLVVRAVGTLGAGIRPSLHIVGGGGGRTYADRITRLAAELGVQLVMRHAISDEELEDEYAGALVYAFGARREPLGLAPLEAMARSLAVVAVGEGGVLETVVDGVTGFLVPPDPGAMGSRLGRLISDARLRGDMEVAGCRAVEERWSREMRAAGLEAAMSRVASIGQPAMIWQ
jgi:glycosyltransferase involved in cell wall biosynthesis